VEKLTNALRSLTGLACSDVVAGQTLGTMVTLEFGAIVRTRRIGTSRRRRDVPIYEVSIFIQDSTWRLEDKSSVICSSAADDNSPGSDLVLGLNRLLGQLVVGAEFRNTAHDLVLHFENGLSFSVFSVPVTTDPDPDNYSVFTPENIFTVAFDGTVTVSPRLVAITK
jgi:hypothetical protein